MHKVVLNIQNLDDPAPIHAFSADLAGAMDAYDSELVLDKKAEMTPEENSSAIKRNEASADTAQAKYAAAKARGVKNQEVK